MKIRIRGNTLRVRLSQSEVDTFREQGHVEERIRFGPGERLVYAMEASPTVGHLAAHYEEGRITIQVPTGWVPAWLDTDQVSLEGEQLIEGDEVLSILVEKDFQCLHRPPTKEDADTFPHPLAG